MHEDTRHVRPERTGWRDEWISRKHREWGFNCPAVDLDFVLCEYDKGQPYVIVEYKHIDALPVAWSHPTMRALRSLADRANLCFLYVTYSREPIRFDVKAFNYKAEQTIGQNIISMNEQEYISLMYRLRGRTYTLGLFEREAHP